MIEDMVKRGSATGRRRAFDKIAAAVGPGPILEGLRLDGEHPLAVWSILKPRDAVTVDAAPESGLAQDCVTVNYMLAGMLPSTAPPGGRMVGLCEGLWTLEVPDHALGRAIERSGLLPDALIAEAHHQLLRLRADVVIRDRCFDGAQRFLVKAGAGGFVCSLRPGEEVSLGRLTVSVRADTWLAEDMLHDDQVLLAEDGKPGERLGDCWLVPAPLCRIVRQGEQLDAVLWGPGLPELLAQPAGRA
jgi:hypothetical protein